MPPFIVEMGYPRRISYNNCSDDQLSASSSSTRRSLVQVELPESKRKIIIERKSRYEQLEARRRVKFSLVKTAYLEDTPVASQMTQDERNLLWWNKEQIQTFEESAKKIAASIPKTPMIGKQEDSYTSVLQRVLNSCSGKDKGKSYKVDPTDLRLLSNFHHDTFSKRGLETQTLNLEESNNKLRETLVYSINLLRDNDRISEDAKLESIRSYSERMTKTSRTFAKALGDADCLGEKPRPKPRRSSAYLMG